MNNSPSQAAQAPRAQIVEKLKAANNILVTVSADPSIDQLSACIAMTLLLNKYKKSATAVFSGKVPSYMNFLNPRATIEKNVDSLRDFIISLDKSKADKLRYKIEDDVVKIFITPYRTSINPKDLKYSAGDFNVDVILALGVQHQQDLDKAITAHGRIFHDAVVLSINNVPGGDFGVTKWEELQSSGLSELVAGLANDLSPGLLDADIATALLTGIVAETSRFSNEKTHPGTMNVSSLLLQAGADQQLVNTQLENVIGTVVNLEAGHVTKPTQTHTEAAPATDDVPEELVIDANGAFVSPETTAEPPVTPAAEAAPEQLGNEPAPRADVSPAPETQPRPEPQPELPQPQPAPETVPAEPVQIAQPDETASQQPASQPAAVIDDADSARRAVEAALGDAPADTFGPTADPVAVIEPPASEPFVTPDGQTAVQPDWPAESQLSSFIQPILPNQPSYANPATTTEYALPATPEHEPAPLSMSPADQAFTMPMPPASSMPAPSSYPATGYDQQPAAGATPPPLPPPMAPPSFGGQGR